MDMTSGITKLLYVAPESLTKEENIEFLKSVPISFIFAIDEAHCISEWGTTSGLNIETWERSSIGWENVFIIGLTATATPKVQEDILKNLGIQNAHTFKASFNRP